MTAQPSTTLVPLQGQKASDAIDLERVSRLAQRLHASARESLVASRLCLFALVVGLGVGVAIFLWANEIVNASVSLFPPTSVVISGSGNQPHISVYQTPPEQAAKAQLDLEWRIRVLNQLSALAARVSIVCILVYLIQFCMRLFRYYHASYHFFLARAEALSLSSPPLMNLADALSFLSADGPSLAAYRRHRRRPLLISLAPLRRPNPLAERIASSPCAGGCCDPPSTCTPCTRASAPPRAAVARQPREPVPWRSPKAFSRPSTRWPLRPSLSSRSTN
jgi:hypothetical protein